MRTKENPIKSNFKIYFFLCNFFILLFNNKFFFFLKKKNLVKKNVISSLKTFKRRSTISIKSDTESITNYNNNYHNRYTTNTRLSFEVDPQRIRIVCNFNNYIPILFLI